MLSIATAAARTPTFPPRDFSSVRLREVLDVVEDENRGVPVHSRRFRQELRGGLIAGVRQRPASQTDRPDF